MVLITRGLSVSLQIPVQCPCVIALEDQKEQKAYIDYNPFLVVVFIQVFIKPFDVSVFRGMATEINLSTNILAFPIILLGILITDMKSYFKITTLRIFFLESENL